MQSLRQGKSFQFKQRAFPLTMLPVAPDEAASEFCDLYSTVQIGSGEDQYIPWPEESLAHSRRAPVFDCFRSPEFARIGVRGLVLLFAAGFHQPERFGIIEFAP